MADKIDSPIAVNDAVSRVLGLATELSNITWEAHHTDPGCPEPVKLDIPPIQQQLHAAVAGLGLGGPDVVATVGGTAAESEPDLAQSCRKIGLDLLLRLERIEKAVGESQDSVLYLDTSKLCALWSFDDVKALRQRLGDLLLQWQPSALDSSRLKLSTLTLRNDMEEAKEIEPPSQSDPPPAQKTKSAKDLFSKPTPSSRRPRVPLNILYDFILEGLAYKSMHDREQEITKAHFQTLNWIFEDQLEDASRLQVSRALSSWLRTDDLGPIYWITGKPGSGKSTLTQFLFHHPIATALLKKWAGGVTPIKAGFFFWTSGSKDQRSQAGLLRSLLYQLLSENLELVPKTFPDLWAKLLNTTTKERIMMVLDWPVEDLMNAFHALLKVAMEQKIKMCLFIDGLDEFEGNHQTIIDFFKEISSGPNGKSLKLCLSSRPWAVFEQAFETAVPNLKLQDVSVGDMYSYALEKLNSQRSTREALAKMDRGGVQFVNDMVQRADGVFLWIRLAVNRLHENFDNHSDPSKLNDILHSLPTELDALFTKFVFEDQTASQVAETAAMFELIRAREIVASFLHDESSNSLTSWELIFALDDSDDGKALELEVEQVFYEDIRSRCKALANRINRRFSGLLVLHERRRGGNLRTTKEAALAERRVTYVHRTVRDWLMEGDGVQARLVRQRPSHFDPHLRLLRSYVLRLKQPVDEIEKHRRLDDWWPEIALAMTHARYIRNDPSGLQRPFVNEMEKTLSWYWQAKPDDAFDHWARNAFGPYEIRAKAAPIWQPFLCLATKFGLTRYVCEEVAARTQKAGEPFTDEEILEMDKATPLLTHAVEFLCSRNKTIYPVSDPEMIKGLLGLLGTSSPVNRGPNHVYQDFMTGKPNTPWLATLRGLRDARRRAWIDYYDVDPQGTARWVEIVRLFIEDGGADVDAVILRDAWDPEITAIGVLELLDETYGAVEVRRLREDMMARIAQVHGNGVAKQS
ncbi:unnamed protein product [Clonostachys chloroleuca]|uniref:NACHT domain-containing protein n=1 Tax=Clonostachys chloroleuca TaxID=1926264 RepID=A0AA35MHC4_9HYPO|nr:unnamed protein product [Clonostachys chloroleuca]